MILPERVFGRSGSRTIRFGAATAYADQHVQNLQANTSGRTWTDVLPHLQCELFEEVLLFRLVVGEFGLSGASVAGITGESAFYTFRITNANTAWPVISSLNEHHQLVSRTQAYQTYFTPTTAVSATPGC